jgi:hypothetical protein
MSDQHRQTLLDASALYVRAKLALANAIISARSAGGGRMTTQRSLS